MSEPIAPIDPDAMDVEDTINELSPELKECMISLEKYHKDLLFTNSHNSQNPNLLISIKNILITKSKIIQQFLINRNIPNLEALGDDKKLQDCLTCLKTNLEKEGYTNESIVILKDLCKKMFEEYPMAMSFTHIYNLSNNN
jgi:hypothetical protein